MHEDGKILRWMSLSVKEVRLIQPWFNLLQPCPDIFNTSLDEARANKRLWIVLAALRSKMAFESWIQSPGSWLLWQIDSIFICFIACWLLAMFLHRGMGLLARRGIANPQECTRYRKTQSLISFRILADKLEEAVSHSETDLNLQESPFHVLSIVYFVISRSEVSEVAVFFW